MTTKDHNVGHISQLFVHPVKSCRGSAVASAEVTARGFAHDREWMVVDATGRFLSQRDQPRLALISTAVDEENLSLSAPSLAPIQIPLSEHGSERNVVVWRDSCRATSAGPEAAEWLSQHLGTPAELVRMKQGRQRSVDRRFAADHHQVGFADGFPFLILSAAAVDKLGQRLGRAIAMERFRPNIVVDGCQAHAEDGWTQFNIGSVAFTAAKPCARCLIVATNHLTGDREPEVLKCLAKYRNVDGEVLFGQNLTHEGGGLIEVGMAVEL